MSEAPGSLAIVTGSNTGLGRAAATELARRGGTVVLACRSEEKTNPVIDQIKRETGNEKVEYLPLDLGDFSSIRYAADQILAQDRHINLLVNNAGVAGQRGMTESGFEMTFGVNHVGHFLLTTLLLDRIVASGPSRIVNVASGNHFQAKGIDFEAVRRPTRTYVGLKEYNVSKLANVLFTRALVERVDPALVSVFSTNPGPVATDVWRRMPGPLYSVYRRLARLQNVNDGVKSTVHAATVTGIESATGTYYDQDCQPKPINSHATAELANELWDQSVLWTADS